MCLNGGNCIPGPQAFQFDEKYGAYDCRSEFFAESRSSGNGAPGSQKVIDDDCSLALFYGIIVNL